MQVNHYLLFIYSAWLKSLLNTGNNPQTEAVGMTTRIVKMNYNLSVSISSYSLSPHPRELPLPMSIKLWPSHMVNGFNYQKNCLKNNPWMHWKPFRKRPQACDQLSLTPEAPNDSRAKRFWTTFSRTSFYIHSCTTPILVYLHVYYVLPVSYILFPLVLLFTKMTAFLQTCMFIIRCCKMSQYLYDLEKCYFLEHRH